MDKLSQRVKELMLTYPTLYPTRFQALLALYSGHGGYQWGKDGTIVPDGRDDTRGMNEMHNFDLETRERDLAQRRAERHAEYSKDLYDRWEREITLERLQRQFIVDNIELVASTTVRLTAPNWESIIDDFSTDSMTYKPIYNIPANVEESFRQGALELIDQLRAGLHYKSACGQDRSVWSALVAVRKQINGEIPSAKSKQDALVGRIVAQLKSEAKNADVMALIEQIQEGLA